MSAIDEVRNYWDAQPCNIKHSKLEVGTPEYFREVRQRKYMVEPHIVGFAEYNKWKDKDVLEIGCGIGVAAVGFAGADAFYTGIDISPESVKLTKQHLRVMNLTGRVLVADAEKWKGETYDLIYSFGVIHHTPDPREIVLSARDMIRPNGEFRFMVYAYDSWKSIMIRNGLDQPEAQHGCPIAWTYDSYTVGNLLRGCFKIVSFEQTHLFPYVLEDYLNYEYKVQPWFKVMPAKMFEALEKELGHHLLVKAVPI